MVFFCLFLFFWCTVSVSFPVSPSYTFIPFSKLQGQSGCSIHSSHTEARGNFLNCKSDHVTAVPKLIEWLPIALRIKFKLLYMAYKSFVVWHEDLSCLTTISIFQQCWPPSSCLFASRTLHIPCSLLGTLFPSHCYPLIWVWLNSTPSRRLNWFKRLMIP